MRLIFDQFRTFASCPRLGCRASCCRSTARLLDYSAANELLPRYHSVYRKKPFDGDSHVANLVGHWTLLTVDGWWPTKSRCSGCWTCLPLSIALSWPWNPAASTTVRCRSNSRRPCVDSLARSWLTALSRSRITTVFRLYSLLCSAFYRGSWPACRTKRFTSSVQYFLLNYQ